MVFIHQYIFNIRKILQQLTRFFKDILYFIIKKDFQKNNTFLSFLTDTSTHVYVYVFYITLFIYYISTDN